MTACDRDRGDPAGGDRLGTPESPGSGSADRHETPAGSPEVTAELDARIRECVARGSAGVPPGSSATRSSMLADLDPATRSFAGRSVTLTRSAARALVADGYSPPASRPASPSPKPTLERSSRTQRVFPQPGPPSPEHGSEMHVRSPPASPPPGQPTATGTGDESAGRAADSPTSGRRRVPLYVRYACTAENRGRRFCGPVRAPLEWPVLRAARRASPTSGSAATAVPPRRTGGAESAPPVTERQLLDLFADLVRFHIAEARPGACAQLLSRYFELAATVVGRHGGTIEVHRRRRDRRLGHPLAEDDAERAVRTALEPVAAVPDLEPGLAMRAAVSTGEAAVTVGARGGDGGGDVVNTTARMQAAAPGLGHDRRRDPPSHRGGDPQRPGGSHELKGKSSRDALARASGGGRAAGAGLEVGAALRRRARSSVRCGTSCAAAAQRAQLVSVTGSRASARRAYRGARSTSTAG